MLRTPDLAGLALDDRYELHAVIGEGAFGRVYRGVDRRLKRPVAVKVIKPWWAEDSQWVERFQREAQMLARVSNPGIVQIFDFGHAEEGPYYVAELVDGESLSERLKRGPIGAGEAREIAAQLCAALGSAHAHGIVHCDVKPANTMVTPEGRVKVADFGVARLAEGTSQAMAATLVGTPRYMAPEQARGLPTTPATDVYSAGVVLYEMLAGRPPFQSSSAVDLGISHLQEKPPPLPADVPAGLAQVLDRALAKEPAARYRDGSAMAVALEAADLSGETAPPTASGRRLPRRAPLPPETPTVANGNQPTIDLAAAEAATAATSVLGARSGESSGGLRRRNHDPRRRRRLAVAVVLLAALIGVVTLALSGSAAKTSVPRLGGLPEGGVRARAQRSHVRPVFSRRHSESPAGIAIAQNPAAGSRVDEGSKVQVVLSAGPPLVRVPTVAGKSTSEAESALAQAGLYYHLTAVPSPGTPVGRVLRQSPEATLSVPRRTTVSLTVAETPRWRALTTFTGVDDGHSVAVRIRGAKWRVSYSMSYRGTCLLIVTCFGPSAQAHNLQSGSTLDSFDMGEGSSQTHNFETGPGLYRVEVSGGQDSAAWTMTVEDYY